MTSISGAARVVRRAGLLAIAAVALTAATQERAQALSLATPGALAVAKYASENLIEVRESSSSALLSCGSRIVESELSTNRDAYRRKL